MADTPYAFAHTRTWWAGTDADTDIHIEAYEGEIEGSFRVESLFRSQALTNFKSVQHQSNTYRGDRIGGVQVRGRKSGQTLDPTRIVNEKYTITVDTTSYVRTPFDYQDDWTAPDFRNEYAAEHGSAHAKVFDTAHIIQLIKAGLWTPPASLAGAAAAYAFKPGITTTATGLAAAVGDEAKAEIIAAKHKEVVTEFVKRDLGGSIQEFVTLMDPDWFSILLDHKKLLNVEYVGVAASGNNYVGRRVAVMNGVRIIETPRFPTAGTVATTGSVASILGAAFEVSADEAKSKMIVYLPKKTLVTVEAKGMTVRQWDDPREFESVLDSYCMYTVGIRRGDATAVVREE